MSSADDTWQMLAGIIEATRLMPAALRAAPASLPLTVIGGFLGSGKTTLVNRLLAGTHGRRLAVLVNDFGRVNVDAALIGSRNADTIALTNGCACCSIAGDLTRALVAVVQREDPPEAIVLEASGIADPRSLAQVALANPALRLDGIITLVDAEALFKHADDAEYGALFRAQVDAADVIVLNKRDLVSGVRFEAAGEWIRERAHGRPLVASVQANVPVEVLLGIESDRALDERRADRDHERHFRSRTLQFLEPVEETAVTAAVEGIEGEILRAKGMVWIVSAPERRTVYQRVGRRQSFTPGPPWDGEPPGSQIVVIAKA